MTNADEVIMLRNLEDAMKALGEAQAALRASIYALTKAYGKHEKVE